MQLAGKRVLITGASRGIGESLAYYFANAGATVALAARSEDTIQALATKLRGTSHTIDLSDPAQVGGFIERVEDEAGPVDVLVNNAGLENRGVGFADSTSEDLRTVTEVNYLAPAELCRQVLPRMLHRGRGHIVNVSSIAGCVSPPGMATYGAAKAALSHFTAGLRADLRGLPIDTTLVELGPVTTDLLARMRTYPPIAGSIGRFYRTHLLVELSRETVAEQVVMAVRTNRKHVRLPKRAMALPMLTETPRLATELILTGIPHQARS